MPRTTTLEKWEADVPEQFQFTLKISNDITHAKKLDIDPESINTFLKAASHIGYKKGCLLIQFPGSVTSAYHGHVEQILKRVYEQDVKSVWRKAIEFRSTSWYENSETYRLLEDWGATIVLHDMPKSNNLNAEATGHFFYFRFHGPKGDYRGDYTEHFLMEQSERIRHILHSGKDVYAYFNNTMGGAFNDAMRLKGMVEK